MVKANTEEWYREADFRADVATYMKRQRLTPEGVALWTDISSGTVRNFLQGGMLSLRVAAGLAELCDLSLDRYRLTQSQHDKLIDEQLGEEFRQSRRVLVQEITSINDNINNMGRGSDGTGESGSDIRTPEAGKRRLAPRIGR